MKYILNKWYGLSRSLFHNNVSPFSSLQLFSDQIEIFGQIQFTKLSILTGIIKIGLKAFLESVRLRTFGKYGLQQVQVGGNRK